MTVAKHIAISPCATTLVAWRDRPRVEKIHFSNGLDGERQNTAQQEGFASAKLARAQLCRNETIDVAPVWEEPRWVPAFVAQLLAQAMNANDVQAPSAAPAYRDSTPQVALFYDRDA